MSLACRAADAVSCGLAATGPQPFAARVSLIWLEQRTALVTAVGLGRRRGEDRTEGRRPLTAQTGISVEVIPVT